LMKLSKIKGSLGISMTAPFFWEGNVSLISEDYHSIKERLMVEYLC